MADQPQHVLFIGMGAATLYRYGRGYVHVLRHDVRARQAYGQECVLRQ
jgi:hypothetical protein